MPKATEAFRNIGEVSVELGVRKHVLRFWEARFPQLKPMKRGGGRRYYRPADVQLLRGIRHLLQTAGYTIKGVQKILREGGVEDVKRLGCGPDAGHDDKSRVRPPPTPPVPMDAPRQLSAAEIGALRTIVAELDAVKAMLDGGHRAQQGDQAGRRPKRAAARS
ncbi:MAG: MerR family transcriptional regulator [Hyphomonadaceae bacterium]|nr:MerR family transcriptional regulator [Hyphomonadaceae bacterium]